ncbi:dienelactone hydrolase family protein [Actinomadura craniellae]|uniref:Dienelactone hydrolase family protein n=1 Tax=Actinomadura craniellae TaxID=2231787 RepID=A0A365GXM5_9ACTN|nr:dienelactone hydrolase family protein [Actinomadura craniellae]RAY11594.1 dienelactone hydrolase family protein [Actinomadura craniellae]
MSAKTESVQVADGTFDMQVWHPASGSGPGLLLIQEIWGVGPYIRAVAERLAGMGYVVGAPDLFWRLQPGWEGAHDEAGLQESMALASRFDRDLGTADLAAALDSLAALPEVTGGAGALGFCLGGTMGYLLAARARPATLVSYYGSGVPDMLDLLDSIECPVQFQFGGDDPYIPGEGVRRLAEAVAGRPGMELHVQEDGGHAFHNHVAPMFYRPEAAARAWRQTEEFLARTLPVA